MKIFKYNVISDSDLDSRIEDAINSAQGDFLEKIRGLPEFERYFDSFSPEELARKEHLFNEYFKKEKNGRKSKSDIKTEVKDLLLNAFDNPPEVDLNFEELYLIQDAVWVKYASDPIVHGAVDNYVDYVLGAGVSTSTPVDEVNVEIHKFEKLNKWFKRQKDIVKNSFIDGEHFTLLWTNNQGDVLVRKCHPKSIENIETAKYDYEVLYSILRRLYQYDDQGNTTMSTDTQYIKTLDYDFMLASGFGYNRSPHTPRFERNVVVEPLILNDSDKIRGIPPLKRALRWSKIYENFIMDRAVLNHERAKVVWIKSYSQQSRDPLQNKTYKAPPGGTMMIEKDGVKYRVEKPHLESSEAKEDGLGLLYYIATTMRFPLHILNQRTDQQVYASIRKADTPFQKFIDSSQYLYADHFERIYRYFLEQKVRRKVLKETYDYPAYSEDAVLTAVRQINEGVLNKEPILDIKNKAEKTLEEGKHMTKTLTVEIPISQDFPQMMLQDPKEMAEVLKIHNEMGIASKATLSAKAGYVWKKEFPKIMSEFNIDIEKKKKEMEAMPKPEIAPGSNKPTDKKSDDKKKTDKKK